MIEKSVINKPAWRLIGISLFTIIGAVYYANSISWGGYGFDPTSIAFSRWFRPEGVIAATSDGRDKDYSVYWGDLHQLKQESFSDFDSIFPNVWINGKTMYLKNGSTLNPRQYKYGSQIKVKLAQRITSFELNQPPGQTNVFLLAQKGMYDWELAGSFTKGIHAGRWCEQSCNFFLYRPAGKNKQHGVILKMPLPGINEENPVHLFVRSQPLIGEASFPDTKKLKQMLNEQFSETSNSKEYVFSNSEDYYPLPVEFRNHQIWWISLKTDRTLVPKEHDSNSTDDRKLGVRVLF
jgi:hypothetical protein